MLKYSIYVVYQLSAVFPRSADVYSMINFCFNCNNIIFLNNGIYFRADSDIVGGSTENSYLGSRAAGRAGGWVFCICIRGGGNSQFVRPNPVISDIFIYLILSRFSVDLMLF